MSFLEEDCISIEDHGEVLVEEGEIPLYTREIEGALFKFAYFVRRPVWRTAVVSKAY